MNNGDTVRVTQVLPSHDEDTAVLEWEAILASLSDYSVDPMPTERNELVGCVGLVTRTEAGNGMTEVNLNLPGGRASLLFYPGELETIA